MSKSLKTIAASILALIIASPAFGKMPYPGFERDMALAFENDGEPMELALLSEQEMRETKGAWFYLYGQLFGGSILGSTVYFLELFDASPGSFSWDGLSAYMTVGALAGVGGVGYTVPGRVILSGSTAWFVQNYYSP